MRKNTTKALSDSSSNALYATEMIQSQIKLIIYIIYNQISYTLIIWIRFMYIYTCVYKREIMYSQDKINPVHDPAYSTTTYQINKHMEMK